MIGYKLYLSKELEIAYKTFKLYFLTLLYIYNK